MAPRRFCDPCGVQHGFQFAASPLKDWLCLQRQLLRKNYSKELRWNHKQEEEFKTAKGPPLLSLVPGPPLCDGLSTCLRVSFSFSYVLV